MSKNTGKITLSEEKKDVLDINVDSGYLSAEVIREQLESFEDLGCDSASSVSGSANVVSSPRGQTQSHESDKIQSDHEQFDSGVIEELKDEISNVRIGDATEIVLEKSPVITVQNLTHNDIRKIIFSQDEDGDTQLHIAVAHGSKTAVSTIITLCSWEPSWLNIANSRLHTALHLAVLSGNAVIARMLVRAGASLAPRDFSGQTALHIATMRRDIYCIHALLRPTESSKVPDSVLNEKNYDGQACVHLAASSGNKDLLACLAHYKCDLNLREGHAGWTPLHIAAHRGDSALVRWLLEQKVTIQRCDYAGRTPRRIARIHGNDTLRYFSAEEDDSDTESDYDEVDDESLFDSLVGSSVGVLQTA